ncbi:serine/threonine protein kinase [Lentibacter algarum]|uniref:serine/threonine-protein kinase n=1 Tax=Lentibacter algarum TaxID=576131 RepID=UPI001C07E0C5|nr:serine/threonine-protein kinase [Lentibacter algarum]MBU2980717.1 serine/threonine protein kinase [Lentibacter algarum]
MKIEIRLTEGTWIFDDSDPLGPPGGFGEVFRGSGECGPVAVKRLMLTADAAAHRELTLGATLSSRTLTNVVPVLDYGQDAQSDRYFLVMPICDYSLEQHLVGRETLEWSEISNVTADVIDGLMEVGDIVHRDLKPGNILWHDGRWKIADFGIAKFVENSTSLQTLKTSLTPQYAAPEQWLMMRSTSATDVYALACIVQEMIVGDPPFTGDFDAIRDGHLRGQPERMPNASARINGLVRSMLRKAQDGRPSLQRCKDIITSAQTDVEATAKNALAEAGLQIATQQAEDDAKRLEEETRILSIKQQGDEAADELLLILNRMFDTITDSSEAANRPYSTAPSVCLGPAELSFEIPNNPPRVHLEGSGWTVYAFSQIKLRCDIERVSYSDESEYTISASLVYAKRPNDSDFRWFEISFWAMNSSFWKQPVALSPNDRNFDVALSTTMGVFSAAFGPHSIDAEDEQSFHDRWVGLFARGASGKLRPPQQMPPPSTFFSDS